MTEEEIAKFVFEHQKNRVVSTDIIVPNTGETLQSHLNSLRKFFELNFDVGNINIMRMLELRWKVTEREITMELKLNGVRWMLVGENIK